MTISYYADPEHASGDISEKLRPLVRRGFQLGWITEDSRPAMPEAASVVEHWKQDRAVLLPGLLDLAPFTQPIEQAHNLMEATLKTEEVASQLECAPYTTQLGERLPLVAAVVEEHDDQGIEKIYFDAEVDGKVVAEELWCKASWLSFHDEDASLRFRFSFGMEGYEDVAADPERQFWAGALCDALFPESAAITANETINGLLKQSLNSNPAYVERIVYFNAPNGGAQMHQDVERGHDGVVFAQMSGSTFWLALAKPLLMDELVTFISDETCADAINELFSSKTDRAELAALMKDRQAMSDYLEEYDHELLEAVMDRLPEFTQYLISRGYAYVLHAGDVLLLPQRDLDNCVWHSVFCMGDEPGEALSFAVRREAEAS